MRNKLKNSYFGTSINTINHYYEKNWEFQSLDTTISCGSGTRPFRTDHRMWIQDRTPPSFWREDPALKKSTIPLPEFNCAHCVPTSVFWDRIQRKTWCIGPYAGVDYNLTLCLLQRRLQFNMGNPMPESTLSLPVRAFDLGLGNQFLGIRTFYLLNELKFC
jgi:hypothetical protein